MNHMYLGVAKDMALVLCVHTYVLRQLTGFVLNPRT